MRNLKRDRNRWLTALAMTCLSGAMLGGCARGNRDVSANLQESAAREAIEAERHVAERKRQTPAPSKSKSKDLLAERSLPNDPVKGVARSKSKSSFDFEETNVDAAELALRPSTSPRQDSAKTRSVSQNEGLENAEWAGNPLENRVKTVSNEEAEEEVEVAESLLDSKVKRPTAKELFEEETGREAESIQKSRSTGKSSTAKPVEARPNKTSFDGTGEHPWAEKSPAIVREKSAPAIVDYDSYDSDKTSDFESDVAQYESGTASLKLEKQRRGETESEDARQLEAQARVQVLLSQAKSFINKEDYRSAYRVAQIAQRIADSENLFFSTGEEQPADVVRSVLMKIRFEEHKLAKTSEEGEDKAASVRVTRKNATVSQSAQTMTSQMPNEWSTGEWYNKSSQRSVEHNVKQVKASGSPWAQEDQPETASPEIRVKPKTNSSKAEEVSVFPKTIQGWKSVSNEPMTLSSSIESDGSKLELRDSSDVVQADNNIPPATDDFQTGKVEAPAPPTVLDAALLPVLNQAERSSSSNAFASAQDWRNQDLLEASPSRSPLLVAPLPPEEPAAIAALATEVIDTSLGIDIEEPAPQQQESKLWMILAAAAGAFGMLFIRRRPSAMPRSAAERR